MPSLKCNTLGQSNSLEARDLLAVSASGNLFRKVKSAIGNILLIENKYGTLYIRSVDNPAIDRLGDPAGV
jgi:hypothetical protein